MINASFCGDRGPASDVRACLLPLCAAAIPNLYACSVYAKRVW